MIRGIVKMTLRIINSGVDTLVLSFKEGTNPSWFECLEEAKNWVNENHMEIPILLGPEKAIITGGNWTKWRYHIRTTDYNIGVSPSKKLPQIYAQINSGAIYAHSLIGAYHYLKLILETLGNYPEAKASRVDQFCDIQGWQPSLKDIDRFVTRAVLVKPVIENGKLTSLNLGAFPFYLRIYNKRAEMRKKGKEELKVVWESSPNYNVDEEVWRIEFEMGRDVFGSTGINYVPDLFRQLLPLWLMALNWCSLRIQTRNKQRSRWPVDPAWLALEAADFLGDPVPAVRERKKKGDIIKILAGTGGYLSSFGREIGVIDLKTVLREIEPQLIEYYASKDDTFEWRVREKIDLLLR